MYDEENEEAGNVSEEKLLELYDGCAESGGSDAVAMQAVVCIVAAVLFFALNMIDPDISERLLEIIHSFADSSKEIMPDPIDWVIERIFH